MSRQRDYQPTIDRARKQAEIAQSREARLREKSDEHHRGMLRARETARIAGEEADALRDRIIGLERSVRDLRMGNRCLAEDRGRLVRLLTEANEAADRAKHPLHTLWCRAREWVRDIMRIGAEA